MGQARTLTERDFKRLLVYVAGGKNALRNRTMLLLTHWAGLRVGEVASLKVGDVIETDGRIKSQIRLMPEQTKGRTSRTVFIGTKLQAELKTFIATRSGVPAEAKLFHTQKSDGFSANTLCQHFHAMYRNAGIDGASSHSGRRTFITNLARKGVGVRVLMALAGHKNISTTQVYIDVNDEMQREAVNLI